MRRKLIRISVTLGMIVILGQNTKAEESGYTNTDVGQVYKETSATNHSELAVDERQQLKAVLEKLKHTPNRSEVEPAYQAAKGLLNKIQTKGVATIHTKKELEKTVRNARKRLGCDNFGCWGKKL